MVEKARATAAAEGGGDGSGAQDAGEAMADMSKLSTARIRKAVDPKIMDVKKRVRAARRKLKRDSKARARSPLSRALGFLCVLVCCCGRSAT
jgi:hypothetical protein